MEIGKVGTQAEAPVMPAAHLLTPQQRLEQDQLIQAVQSLNESKLFGQNSELTFSIDRYTKKPVLRLVDKATQEVIRQIPPEYLLRLAEEAG
ncbi:MAG: flagellar protein FlaG [Candidatus Solibacter usitatus]|nr:flagellar protein FlaG [Candidatus Solibacter usitatus]